MQVDFRELEFKGVAKARDVWRAKDVGSLQSIYKVHVPGHGVVLVRVSE